MQTDTNDIVHSQARKVIKTGRFTRMALAAAALFAVAGGAPLASPVLGEVAAPPVVQPNATKLAEGGVSAEAMGEVLNNLGYDVNTYDNNGVRSYSVRIESSDLTFVINISLSGSQRNVWLNSSLGTLPNAQQNQALQLLKLLQLNDQIGPTHFSVDKSSRIEMNLAITNEKFTPRKLREGIDGFMTTIRNTQKDWDAHGWPTPTDAPATTAAAAR